jgi:hypothetical protein
MSGVESKAVGAQTGCRRWFAALALAVLTATAAGCAVEASPPKGNCSPGYEAPSKLGSFSAQQSGPGASIQWGIYPNYPAARFVVDVFAGSRKVDHKDQNYPPHGSVNAKDVAGKSGQDFTVSGQITDAKNNLLNFQLKCVIA